MSMSTEERRLMVNAATRRYRKTPQGQVLHRHHNRERYHRLKANGLCANCGKCPPKPNSVHCQDCRNKIWAGTKAWRARMVENGICTRCGKTECLPVMKGRKDSFCERCYFRKASADCLKTTKHAEAIGKKLKEQNYRCAYTGEEIVLGLNDSIDHILPSSRYPDLLSDPNNIQWVTRKVNCMKWDSTHEEFLATALAIVRYNHLS